MIHGLTVGLLLTGAGMCLLAQELWGAAAAHDRAAHTQAANPS